MTETIHTPDPQQEPQEKFKVGSILMSSWGYDQTNVDFYKVKRRTRRSVWLVEIGSELVEGSGGFMSGKVTAVPERETGKTFMKRIRVVDDEEVSVSIESYANAYPWNGRECSCSWYA